MLTEGLLDEQANDYILLNISSLLGTGLKGKNLIIYKVFELRISESRIMQEIRLSRYYLLKHSFIYLSYQLK